MAIPGNYTFLIGAGSNPAVTPGGFGFGTMKLSKSGKISLEGTLGEGTTFSQKAQLLGQDRWIVTSPLYNKAGLLLGWSRFSTNESGNFTGNLSWIKPGALADAYYPTGFASNVELRGAPFFVEPVGKRALNWTNGVVVLQGGNLQRALTYRVELNADDTFTVQTGTGELTLALDRNTGKVTGSFFHPVTQADVPLQGTIVKGFEEGGGLFYGPDQTGSFSIRKQ
jgi:hypothetical protein